MLVGWDWGGHRAYLDLCGLQVDAARGSGFTLPAYDSTSGYTDTESLPATPKKWTYRVDDHGVGQWSNPVNLTVGG